MPGTKYSLKIWDASGMATEIVPRNLKTPKGSIFPKKKLLRSIDTAIALLESKLPKFRYYLYCLAIIGMADSFIRDNKDSLESVISEDKQQILLFVSIMPLTLLLLYKNLLPSKITDKEATIIKHIAKQAKLEVKTDFSRWNLDRTIDLLEHFNT